MFFDRYEIRNNKIFDRHSKKFLTIREIVGLLNDLQKCYERM